MFDDTNCFTRKEKAPFRMDRFALVLDEDVLVRGVALLVGINRNLENVIVVVEVSSSRRL